MPAYLQMKGFRSTERHGAPFLVLQCYGLGEVKREGAINTGESKLRSPFKNGMVWGTVVLFYV
jgi:hypothetical protein